MPSPPPSGPTPSRDGEPPARDLPGLTDPDAAFPASDGFEEAGRARTRRGQRRAIAWGLGVSALFHVVLVLLYPGLGERLPEVRVTPSPVPTDLPMAGIEIVTMRDDEEEPTPEDEAPPPEIVVDLPDPAEEPSPLALPTPTAPALPQPPSDAARPTERDDRQRAAAELLRPQMGDPRLWAPLDRSILDLSDEERAEIYLRGMIRDWNDSVAVAVALSGEATDWTYTDAEGRRWGLSPGRLHLGDFSVPLPLSFQLPQARRNDQMVRNWEIADILRGVASVEVRQSWAERAREIRERMDADRAAAQAGGNGGTGGGGPGNGPPGGGAGLPPGN